MRPKRSRPAASEFSPLWDPDFPAVFRRGTWAERGEREHGRPRLGRPPELDAERIVATAIALADRDGLAGATLSKVAAALGVTPMSLYRHIRSRDGLTDRMADTAFGLPPDTDPDWRRALHAWADAQLAVYTRHPWIAQIPISGPPRGFNALAWMDAGLAALRGTGLDWGAKIGVITVVGGYVRQAFVTGRNLAERRLVEQFDEATALQVYQQEVAVRLDPGRFPEIEQLFADQAFADVPPDQESAAADFRFGLDLILDGVDAAISR